MAYMRDLIDIIKIVTPESLVQINLFTPKVKTRTKFNQLYNKIRLGEIQTNEDAIDILYKKDKQGKQKLIRLKDWEYVSADNCKLPTYGECCQNRKHRGNKP